MRRFLLLLLTVFILPLSPAQAQRPDAPPYALRGNYPVGTRELTIEGERTLRVTAWYPAVNRGNVESIVTYPLGIFSVPGRALRDVEPDLTGAPYPLVVFSHGAALSRVLFAQHLEHLASQGFVVLAADHPGNTILDALNTQRLLDTIPAGYAQRPLDVLRLIDFADELTGSAGALEGLIDTERIALIGHSFGGYTMMAAAGGRLDFDGLQGWCAENAGGTLDPYPEVALYTEEALSFDGAAGTCFLQDDAETVAAEFGYEAVPEGLWPAVTDERIDALVTFAPWNAPVFGEDGLAEVDVPALIVVGSADSVTNPERDAFTYYDRLGSADKTLAVFDNANHFIYLDECSPALLNAGQFFVCSDAVWDMQRTHDIINHLTTAFLLETLYGDEAAGAAFAEAEFPGIAITPSGNQ